jgi:SpoVK/Ycf46/Vps4 family AAA+-type ATPase
MKNYLFYLENYDFFFCFYLGRLGRLIYIALPAHESRMAILQDVLEELPRAEDGVLNLLANQKDFSGEVLTKICQHAYKLAARESIEEKKERIRQTTMDFEEPATVLQILHDHFEEAITLARRLAIESDTCK